MMRHFHGKSDFWTRPPEEAAAEPKTTTALSGGPLPPTSVVSPLKDACPPELASPSEEVALAPKSVSQSLVDSSSSPTVVVGYSPSSEVTSVAEPVTSIPQESFAQPPSLKQPAHRLLLDLEQVPSTRVQGVPREGLLNVRASEEIASANIEVPAYSSPRAFLPSWGMDAVWYIGVGLLAIALLSTGYAFGMRAPVPERSIAKDLREKRVRAEKAVLALELGHRYAADQGDEDRAISAYEEALKHYPALPDAERGLAIILGRIGEKQKATHHYELYLELAPGADDAAQVKRILSQWGAVK